MSGIGGNGSKTARKASEAIDAASQEGRAALIAYLPLGFPSFSASLEAVSALIAGGADLIELGWPYSDPVMDGPVIADAVTVALAGGIHLEQLFEAVEVLAPLGVPVEVMTYYNPVFHYGVEAFAARLARAGGAGLITPDLIPEEAGDWIREADRLGLDKVFLVAPTSPPQRLRSIAAACRGFTYATSTMGVTGERASLSAMARPLVDRTRLAGARRVCVGIGVSTPDQAREVASFADGVIVGSAFVARLSQGQGAKGVEELASQLRRAALK
jgi:tryptophan synthase alpha chain